MSALDQIDMTRTQKRELDALRKRVKSLDTTLDSIWNVLGQNDVESCEGYLPETIKNIVMERDMLQKGCNNLRAALELISRGDDFKHAETAVGWAQGIALATLSGEGEP